MATLKVEIANQGGQISHIPKWVKVLNTKLETVEDFWLKDSDHKTLELAAGVYVVQVAFPSGKELRQVAKVVDGSTIATTFQLEGIGAHESHNWAHLSRKVIKTPVTTNLVHSRYLGSWIRLWRLENNQWSVRKLHISGSSSWSEEGVSYTFYIDRGLQFLQVGGPQIPWRFIALPPNNELKCLIKPNNGPRALAHPLEVVVASPNWEAETILTLLKNNDMDKAQNLYEQSTLKDATAETLLQGKMRDPCSAAIGAYYLLRMEKFDRLHDWARNLANWMAWMPDGSIIWAWQLIKEGRRDNNVNIEEVRSRLLEAYQRGVPIYTEGFRLLWDGLRMLADAFPNDEEVKTAVNVVYGYVEALDWNCAVTTFNGRHPSEPSKKSRKGTPKDMSYLAYIYDVPTKAIMQSSELNPDDMLEVNLEGAIETFKVSNTGTLLGEKGERYKSISDVGNKLNIDLKESSINISRSNIDLGEEIKQYRMGNRKKTL